MKTVGEILKEARIEKKISLEEIEKLTKIRKKFLLAIEENSFSQIFQSPTIRGFIRNYAQILGLNPEAVLAVFRRDFSENEKGQIVPKGMIMPIDKTTLSWSPRLTVILTVFLILGLFFGYLGKQYLNYVSSPKIIVSSPPEGKIFSVKEIDVTGKTGKDVSLYINGEIINLGENGEFNKKITLFPGESEIVFEAVSRKGKKTRLVRRIKVQTAD